METNVMRISTIALCIAWALNGACLAVPHLPTTVVPEKYAVAVHLVGLVLTVALMLLPIFTGILLAFAVHTRRAFDRWIVLLGVLIAGSVVGYAKLFNAAFLFNFAVYFFGVSLIVYVIIVFYEQYQLRAQTTADAPPEKKQSKKKQ